MNIDTYFFFYKWIAGLCLLGMVICLAIIIANRASKP